jgi:hypothetical protein
MEFELPLVSIGVFQSDLTRLVRSNDSQISEKRYFSTVLQVVGRYLRSGEPDIQDLKLEVREGLFLKA